MVGLKGAGKTTILHKLIGEIVQGYRNRYNLINCGRKIFFAYQTAGQIHERFSSESFRCAKIINLCLQGVPHIRGFHYRGSHYCNFWLMYVQVGDFCVSRGPPTVPLTRISCNAFFFKSQNPRKAGTLCILQKLQSLRLYLFL